MIRTLRGWAAGAVLALAVTASGCAGNGWEDVLNGRDRYGYGSDVRGEVRDVGSRTIEVRTENGRSARVRYDGSTDVRYRDRRYSVRSLERGDYVTVRTSRDRGGDLYARSVVVQRSARADRGGYDGRTAGRRVERRDDRRVPPRRADAYARGVLDGRVGLVDRRTMAFQLRSTERGTVQVIAARSATRDTRNRIDRLRQGEYVRLRGRFIDENRFEVEGFR
jgi:hypothetical protein